MKNLKKFDFPVYFFNYLHDIYPNTLIKISSYCGADKRINWDYTMLISIYDPENNRFDAVGYFYDDERTDALDFFEHNYCSYYSYKDRFYNIIL